MADLMQDTRVEPGGEPGVYRGNLSDRWAVWGPYGGYVGAIALRALLAESRFARPASFHCNYLAVGEFGPVELQVTKLGGGKRAESLRVDLRQGDRLLLTASGWTIDDGLVGFEHDFGRPPDVPGVEALKSFAEHAPDDYPNWYSIWRNIEGRPVTWNAPPGDPVWHCWLRLEGTKVADVEADAVRQLFWLDMSAWNATTAAHAWPFRHLAPNFDLAIQFHRFAPELDWMLADGHVPVATAGTLGGISRVWAPDGRLLSTGASSHSCRPNPGYAEELEQARAQGLVGTDD